MRANEFCFGPLRISMMQRRQLCDAIASAINGETNRLSVAFCNAYAASIAFRQPEFAAALGSMLVVNDGIGIELGARFLIGRGFEENLNGTDFIPYALENFSRPMRVYLLGGLPGVAEDAAKQLSRRFASFICAGAHHGYFDAQEEDAIVSEIAAQKPDILLVALGNPRQELFIARHSEALNTRVMMGVGALFDFVSGRTPRAPLWMRRMRLEWIYRLALEPKRLGRRYTLELAHFFVSIARTRFSHNFGLNIGSLRS